MVETPVVITGPPVSTSVDPHTGKITAIFEFPNPAARSSSSASGNGNTNNRNGQAVTAVAAATAASASGGNACAGCQAEFAAPPSRMTVTVAEQPGAPSLASVIVASDALVVQTTDFAPYGAAIQVLAATDGAVVGNMSVNATLAKSITTPSSATAKHAPTVMRFRRDMDGLPPLLPNKRPISAHHTNAPLSPPAAPQSTTDINVSPLMHSLSAVPMQLSANLSIFHSGTSQEMHTADSHPSLLATSQIQHRRASDTSNLGAAIGVAHSAGAFSGHLHSQHSLRQSTSGCKSSSSSSMKGNSQKHNTNLLVEGRLAHSDDNGGETPESLVLENPEELATMLEFIDVNKSAPSTAPTAPALPNVSDPPPGNHSDDEDAPPKLRHHNDTEEINITVAEEWTDEHDSGIFKIPLRVAQVKMIVFFNHTCKWTTVPAFVLHWVFKRPVKMIFWPVGLALSNTHWFAFILWVVVWSALFDSILTHTLKDALRMPRPQWVIPALRNVKHATSSSYSFPSGHTHAVSNVLFMIAIYTRLWWAFLVWIAATVIMAISRTALAVHWPQDVLCGALTGVVTGGIGLSVNPRDRMPHEVRYWFTYTLGVLGLSMAIIGLRTYALWRTFQRPKHIESLGVQVKQHNTFTDLANFVYVFAVIVGTGLKWAYLNVPMYTMGESGWPLAYHLIVGSTFILFGQHVSTGFFGKTDKAERVSCISAQLFFGTWHSIGAVAITQWMARQAVAAAMAQLNTTNGTRL